MDIYNGLDPRSFETHVCTFFPGEYDRYFSAKPHLRHVLVGEGTRAARTPLGKGVNLISRLKQLRRAIDRSGAQVVHTHHLGPLLHVRLLQTLARARLPWVHTEHNVPDLARGYAHPLFKGLAPLRRPDYVTAVSPNVCEYLQSTCRVLAERIRTIPNGVDLERFDLATERRQLRQELKLSPDDEAVGCIGNLRAEKNQQLAIQAVARLRDRRPRLKLVICGDGDQRAGLERLSRSLNMTERIVFLGYRFDIPQILSALDLFCLPSVYEGMPVSVLEAWAARKPVVATDVIGIRDLVVHGETGYLVAPDDTGAMAAAIDLLLSQPEEMNRLAANGRRMASRKYSLRAMVAQYAELYERLVGK